jgi:UDP-GlcNAc:undecaprenyl-phosphate GlcNAc-1-phosphate transferase
MSLSPLIVSPLATCILAIVLHSASLSLFPRWKLLDFPERYGLQRMPLPYPTGSITVLLFLALSPLLFSPITTESLVMLIGIFVLAVVCFIDDRSQISPFLRIGLQLCIAMMIVAGGIRIEAITNPLPWAPEGDSLILTSGWMLGFSAVFTTLWLLVTINALNWFDGIPGQVSVLSTIAFLTIGFLSLSERVHQPALALIAFALAGLGAAAFMFDFPPPKVVMGDTGAMFFGLMIGILTIYSGGKVATAFLVLGVPLLDFVFVIVRRMARRQSIFHGNAQDQHLHHRLLGKGWTPRQVLFLTASIGTSFGITALFLSTKGKLVASFILFLVMIGLSWYTEPVVKETSKTKNTTPRTV